MSDNTYTLTRHLEELRKVLIFSIISVIIGTGISYGFFLDKLMFIITKPIISTGTELVFLGVTEGFMTQLKVAIFGGFIIAAPIIFWQLLSFILPALYSHEKKIFWPLVLISMILFIGGIFFAYTFVLEMGLRVLLINFSAGLTPMISVNKYISFVVAFLLPFGVIFEIPLITYFLTHLGIITPEFLRKNRRYVILIMFVLAAVLSPGGDVTTQLFLAIPMILLFEISIIISSLTYRKKQIKEPQQ